MRWVALALILMAVPFLSAWLRQNPARRPLVWGLMGFFPFVTGAWNLDAAIISWPLWPGHVTGIELSLADSIALAIVLGNRGVWRNLPFLWLFIAYILAVAISVPMADIPMSAVFYVWQLLRMLVFFAAVASICMDERGPKALLTGMACGMMVAAGYSINQRLSGAFQSSGTFVHQNLLGMVSHFFIYPALALVMRDRGQKVLLIGIFAAVIAAILGASRATIGFVGLGVAATVVLGVAFRPTSRKIGIMGMSAIALALAAPLALSSLQNRFEIAPTNEEEYDERAAFEKAARAIFSDHPFGIGPNQYVVVANTKGYSARAGVAATSGSLSTRVHNIYLLNFSETGFLGGISFLALIFVPIITCVRFAWRNRRNPQSDVMIGVFVAFSIVATHSLYEWSLATAACQYVFAATLGIAASRLRLGKAARARAKAPTVGAIA